MTIRYSSCERGSIFYPTLIFGFLLGMHLLIVGTSIWRTISQAGVENGAIRRAAQIESRAGKLMRNVEDSGFSLNGGKNLEVLRGAPLPLIRVFSENTAGRNVGKKSYLLSLLRYNGRFYPDWGALSVTENFSSGNIDLDIPLVIPSGSSTVRMSSLGDIKLKKGIIIKDAEKSTLEIIAAGKIYISDVTKDKEAGVRLLLHSDFQSVEINSVNPLSLCDGPPVNGSVSLYIEALKGIRIQGRDLKNQDGGVGCNFPRSVYYWPVFKIVGEEN